MSHGYAIANALSGLAASAFTWSSAYATNRDRLNDGVMDLAASGSAAAFGSGQTLGIDFGSATALAGFALLNHNLATGACTVKVEGADDVGFTVGVVIAKAASTVTTTAPNQKDTVLQFPSATKRYWRLTFVHTGTKIVTLGELLALATIAALSRATIYGAGETERYVLNRNDSETGNLRSTFLAGPLRSKTLPFKDLSTSERNELLTMFRATKGGNANLLWVEFIESTATAATAEGQECIWGKIAPTLSWTQDDYRLFTPGGLEITGLGREVGA